MSDWEQNYELRLRDAEAIGRQGMIGGHGEHLDPDRGTKDKNELDQIYGQRRDSAATKQAERQRDGEIERIKNGEAIDDDGKVWTQEEMRDEKPHHERKLQIAERFANDRRMLQGLATRDKSLTEVENGKFDDRMTWRNGRLVEKSWVENAAFSETNPSRWQVAAVSSGGADTKRAFAGRGLASPRRLHRNRASSFGPPHLVAR